MSEPDWAFPAELRPRPEDWDFDLERALGALVLLRTEVPEDAFTAQILGTERVGNGIAIGDDGLILTIGYLVTEASAVWRRPVSAPRSCTRRIPSSTIRGYVT